MHHYKNLVSVLCQQLLPSHEYTSLLGSISLFLFIKLYFVIHRFLKISAQLFAE